MKLSALALAVCLCAIEADAADFEAKVRSPAGSPVVDAAVVLEPVARNAPTSKTRASIEQRDRDFIPYLTIVRKGTAVTFPNHDPIKHHVYSFSPAKTFELKLYSGQSAQPVVFDKTGEVALGCNIHDWMEAHVLVVDTPWFARTGADGIAHIKSVPAGEYRLRVWHPQQREAFAEQSLHLPAKRVELSLDVAPRMVRPKPAADADGY